MRKPHCLSAPARASVARDMADEDADIPDQPRPLGTKGRKRRLARRILLLITLLLLAALLLAWWQRYRIADNILADELARRGIEGRYRIERIGPTRQILSDIEIGDRAAPDLTIDRLEIRIRHRFGLPAISSVRVVRPRLVGSYRNGELSFGALDPLIFTEDSGEPFQLPDFALAIDDGRARIASDYGNVALRVSGGGHLRDGFDARLAAAAPELVFGGCTLEGANLGGTVTIAAERPGFEGPLRFDALECAEQGVALAGGSLPLDLRADRDLAGVEGSANVRLAASELPGATLAALAGQTRFTYRDEALTARYDLQARGVRGAPASASLLEAEGLLRTRRGLSRVELDGSLAGRGILPGARIEQSLANAAALGSGTLVQPLLARIAGRLGAESRASTLTADFTLRSEDGRNSLIVPEAIWRGRSGQALVNLSGGQLALDRESAPQFAGNLVTGGAGLPQLSGRIERGDAGATRIELSMAPYEADDARLAVPALSITQDSGGALTFDGELLATGAIPGGRARDLLVPLSGRWSTGSGIALWDDCTRLQFASLEISTLVLDDQALTLCPPRGRSIVSQGPRGLSIAAGTDSLDLRGRLGSTPVAIVSGPVGLAFPGVITASDVAVALGPAETATRFVISDLDASFGEAIGGTFAEADVFLASVPLDILNASGQWSYAGGVLALSEGALTIEDRGEPNRFRPMIARDATLSLENNLITANATLREAESDTLVSNVDIAHDLSTGTGYADLAIPGIDFGSGFQPTDLTRLALGVVANVEGRVTGEGRIDWSPESLTSTGRFSSDDLDLAAAFGPVEGASGTIEFTDLLGLTTAPRQRIAVRGVNPGIEIYDGEVAFQVREGAFIDVQSARWPFLGGTLAMRPLTIGIGVAEERGYILDIEGLEAAQFIERMQLNNLSATGTFDGTIPVIFDVDGNGRIEGGSLLSRPPGGNLAYVGQLTYEDLSTMANFAFDTLRSLDYRQMQIRMDGPLTGELVTRVAFDGVRQGEGASQNILTRQLAKLPLRLVINIRAPFYRLISSVRSLYDPSAVRDPRSLGLLTSEGDVLRRETDQDAVDALDEAAEAAEAAELESDAQ